MKARGKVISLVTAILCLVPLFVGALGFGDQASAAIEMVNVTLHKKKMDDFPIGGIQNDGKEMADEFDKYEPLEGVTFSAYDITDDFYTALDKELKGDEDPAAYKAVVKKVMEGFKFSDIKIKNKLDSQSTDDRGKQNLIYQIVTIKGSIACISSMKKMCQKNKNLVNPLS